METDLIRQVAAEATAQCKRDFKDIEQGLSLCFQTNPGRRIPSAERKRLVDILNRVIAIRDRST